MEILGENIFDSIERKLKDNTSSFSIALDNGQEIKINRKDARELIKKVGKNRNKLGKTMSKSPVDFISGLEALLND